MICNNCQTEIPDNAKFCNKCGQKTDDANRPISNPKKNGKSILTGVVSVIVFLLAFGVVRYLTQEVISPSGSSTSKAELISQTVKEVKASMSLPSQVDEATTLVDITAELNAIRYHYVLSGLDTNNLSNDYLKTYLGTSICQNKDTKALLNQDINMEYSYSVKSSTKKYFISFTKTDCN